MKRVSWRLRRRIHLICQVDHWASRRLINCPMSGSAFQAAPVSDAAASASSSTKHFPRRTSGDPSAGIIILGFTTMFTRCQRANIFCGGGDNSLVGRAQKKQDFLLWINQCRHSLVPIFFVANTCRAKIFTLCRGAAQNTRWQRRPESYVHESIGARAASERASLKVNNF